MNLKNISLWLVACILVACHPPRKASFFAKPVPLHARDYPSILKTWTRTGKIYHYLDNRLFITSTFHTPELQRAFSVAFPNIYGAGGAITRRELLDPTEAIQKYLNFFITTYTPNAKWNDFSYPDSIWKITLNVDGTVLTPAEITAIKIDENLKAVYPYIGTFDKAYLIRFAAYDAAKNPTLQTNTKQISMHITSALGSEILTWQLN